MPVKAISLRDLVGMTVSAAGYSSDYKGGKTPATHENCIVKAVSVSDGDFSTDCDFTRGASGGPTFIWQDGQPVIVGINVSENRGDGEESFHVPRYSNSKANFSNEVINFIATLQRITSSSVRVSITNIGTPVFASSARPAFDAVGRANDFMGSADICIPVFTDSAWPTFCAGCDATRFRRTKIWTPSFTYAALPVLIAALNANNRKAYTLPSPAFIAYRTISIKATTCG